MSEERRQSKQIGRAPTITLFLFVCVIAAVVYGIYCGIFA